MSSSTNFKYSRLVLGTLLLSTLLVGIIDISTAGQHADEPVDCIVIKYSACPDCVNKYNSYVDPFFQEYRLNDSIDFAFIDASTETAFFFEQMEVHNISVGAYGDFPWVIFLWDNDQKVVLDIEAILGDSNLLVTSFESILVDIGYIPPDNNGNNNPSFDFVDFSLLTNAAILIGGILLIVTLIGYLVNEYTQLTIHLRRIEKNRIFLFTTLTLVSLISLTYQFLDYLQGGCGCTTNDLAKTLLFRKYEIYNIFGFEIPFSMVGIVIMTLVLIQVIFLSIVPLPLEIPLGRERSFLFKKLQGEYWYYFIVFQLFLTVGALFYLLYLELFVINFICILCTISQTIIVINTILIMTWNPFPKKEAE